MTRTEKDNPTTKKMKLKMRTRPDPMMRKPKRGFREEVEIDEFDESLEGEPSHPGGITQSDTRMKRPIY